MYYAGWDVGSRSAKGVIMRANEIIASDVIRALADPQKSAQQIAQRVIEQAKINPDQIHYSVGTGYGRKHIDIAQRTESEITCHAKAAHWQNQAVRMVVDIGGQDAKAIRLNAAGEVVRYAYNDKCASGTGRFLEIIAQTLDLSSRPTRSVIRGGAKRDQPF